MEQKPDAKVPQKNRCVFWIFYLAGIVLLLGAIVASLTKQQCWKATAMTKALQMMRQRDIQEQRESNPKVVAAAEVDVQQLIHIGELWHRLNVAAFVLAILSLGIARRHYEKQRRVWAPVIVLFSFYIVVEMLLL